MNREQNTHPSPLTLNETSSCNRLFSVTCPLQTHRLQSLMLLMTLASLLCLAGKAGQEVTDNVNSKVPRIPHDRLASGWYTDFQEQPQDQ